MGNYNDDLMEQLADQGDGFYSYVDTFDEAERLFGAELTTTLVPVAAEARAQVRFDPELVSSYRLIGYEDRALDDEEFEDLGVDAGELGAGPPRHRALRGAAGRSASSRATGSAPPSCAGPTRPSGTRPPGSTAESARPTESSPEPDASTLAGAVADTAQLHQGRGA